MDDFEKRKQSRGFTCVTVRIPMGRRPRCSPKVCMKKSPRFVLKKSILAEKCCREIIKGILYALTKYGECY